MANFRSLIGGPFGDGTTGPVAFRANNPGAINGAAWERNMPGYVGEMTYDGRNNTTVFETPEQGVAVWIELLRRYRARGKSTVESIITMYGGGQANYPTEYLGTVLQWTGLLRSTDIQTEGGDDVTLLKFAKAMFAYESGYHPPRPLPWSDAQIVYGFKLARRQNDPSAPVTPSKPVSTPPSIWDWLFAPLFKGK